MCAVGAVFKSTSNLIWASNAHPHSQLLAVGFYLIICHTVAISGLMEVILYVRDLVRSHLPIHYYCRFSPAAPFAKRAAMGNHHCYSKHGSF